jgi:hypothetical protein
MGKFIITEEEKKHIRNLYEQNPTGTTEPNVDKDGEIKKLGMEPINSAFIKYGFERNDNPPIIRSLYQYVVTYDKKPFFQGDITEDGQSGVKVLVSTPLKDIAIQKCGAKTHSLDKDFIILTNDNADCVLGRLTNQIVD